jgi:hypothetical protein
LLFLCCCSHPRIADGACTIDGATDTLSTFFIRYFARGDAGKKDIVARLVKEVQGDLPDTKDGRHTAHAAVNAYVELWHRASYPF